MKSAFKNVLIVSKTTRLERLIKQGMHLCNCPFQSIDLLIGPRTGRSILVNRNPADQVSVADDRTEHLRLHTVYLDECIRRRRVSSSALLLYQVIMMLRHPSDGVQCTLV